MINTELLRLKSARDSIRSKLVALGIAENDDKLDTLAALLNEIQDNGAVDISLKEGETYLIPRGYHSGAGKVSGIAGGGNYSLQEKEITPSEEIQTVSSDNGYYGLSEVTVRAIPAQYQDISEVTAIESDVLEKKSFVKSNGTMAEGTMKNNGYLEKTIDGLSITSCILPTGFISGGEVSLTEDIERALSVV